MLQSNRLFSPDARLNLSLLESLLSETPIKVWFNAVQTLTTTTLFSDAIASGTGHQLLECANDQRWGFIRPVLGRDAQSLPCPQHGILEQTRLGQPAACCGCQQPAPDVCNAVWNSVLHLIGVAL